MARPALAPGLLSAIGWASLTAALTPLLLPPIPAYRTLVVLTAAVLFGAALATPRAAFVLAVVTVTVSGASALAFGSPEPASAGPVALCAYLAGASLKGIYEIGTPPPNAPLLPAWRAFAAASAVSAAASVVGLRTTYLLFRGVPPPRMVNVDGADAAEVVLGVVAALAALLTAAGLYRVTAALQRDERGRRTVDAALVFAALVAGGMALLQKLAVLPVWRSLRWEEWNRAQSTFTDPSSAGVAVALLIAPILARATTGPPFVRFLAAVSLPLLLVILSDAGSRAGLIGALTASVLYVLWGITRLAAGERAGVRRRVASTVGTLAILSALALAAALAWPNRGAVRSALLARLEAPFRKELTPFERTRERLLLYEGCLACFSDHPVTGIGLGAFRAEFPNTAAEVLLRPAHTTDHPPSFYLGTLAESGLAGGALLFLLLVGIVRAAGRALTLDGAEPTEALAAAGAAAATIGLLVVFLFGSHLIYPEIAAYVGILTGRLSLPQDARTGRVLGALVPVVLAGALVLLVGNVLVRAYDTRSPAAAFQRSDTAGIYPSEREPDGRSFRWTSSAAAWRLRGPAGSPALLSLPVKNGRPDERPVLLQIFWDDRLLGSLSLPASGWKRLEIPVAFPAPAESEPARFPRAAPPLESGVLRIGVSESFRPSWRLDLGSDGPAAKEPLRHAPRDSRLLGIEVGDALVLPARP
jgi:O-antigen ligase